MNQYIIIEIVFLLLFFCLYFFLLSVYKYIKRYRYVKEFTSYISLLEYYMERAYDVIYKDRILTYSLDAYRVPENEYNDITRDYTRAVQKFLGPSLLKEFVELYGDEESFLFNILQYFEKKYEEDEIRKTAMENLTSEEENNGPQ